MREAEKNEMLRINAGKMSDGGDDITSRQEEDVERKTRGETLRRQRSQVNSNITFITIIITNYIFIEALKWNNTNRPTTPGHIAIWC